MTCSRCRSTVPNPWCYVCAGAEPFSEGVSAFHAGEPKSANPHAGRMAGDWDEGWEQGREAAETDPVPTR